PNPVLIAHRDNGKDVAVVFVHGFQGHPGETWGQFPHWLMGDEHLNDWDVFSLGYPTKLWLDVAGIWSADPELVTAADQLRPSAKIRPKKYKSLALVAHSMGGLVVQPALADDPAFARRVSHVFLFGTPSNGLVKAWWARLWKRQIRDMA